MSSAIAQLKKRLQEKGFHTNERSTSQDVSKPNPPQARDSKSGRSKSPLKGVTGLKQPTKVNSSYLNLTKKTVQPTDEGESQKTNPQGKDQKKKIKLSNIMFNPTNTLEIVVKPELNQERENQNQNCKKEEDFQVLNEFSQININEAAKDTQSLSIQETLFKMSKKLESAQRKMNSNRLVGGKAQPPVVSGFMPAIPEKVVKHNSDLIVNTEDVSDIKHTSKMLFVGDSTAPMTGKGGSTVGQLTTPMMETSQFTLNTLDESNAKTPAQFKSSNSSKTKYQDTDEDGNRLSILPGKSRPKAPSTKKANSTKKAKAQQEEEAPKNMLDKIRGEAKVLESSKGIKKGGQERKNFVKINLKQNYKPHLRGEQFTSKIMAKKRNNLKSRERFARKMQIENAKNRDQVNIYGGLGRVGLDHEGGTKCRYDDPEIQQALAPTFSGYAMKYAKKVPQIEGAMSENEDSDSQLAEGLEDMDKQLLKIDEEVQEEDDDQDQPNYKIPTTDEGFRQILEEKFGHKEFKEGQLEAIKILLKKRQNTLVVLATGGGKSLVYQYCSQFLPGLVVVVTPLISLMTDQLGKLPDFIPGACLNSQQTFQMKKQIVQAIVDRHIKVIFISPERFFMEDFTKYGRKISMVCVDEIHCASEWSHNFRPTYLKLNDMIRDKLGEEVLVLGLTATATKATQERICTIFKIDHQEHIVTQPNLSRMNLQLSITRDSEKLKALLCLLKSDSFKKLTSILIFATHKKTTEQLASYLTQNGIMSQAYHAGKTDVQRAIIQKSFINNQVKVLVCTIAFSMGIDKSDIQSVIHYDLPRSIESYVQEIGRSGRDGKLARCHLFLNNDDFYSLRRLILSNLLDNQNAFRLTNKVIVEGKKELIRKIKPELLQSKKRKLKTVNGDVHTQIIEEFEHESEIAKFYSQNGDNQSRKIDLESMKQLTGPLFVFLNVKETEQLLDLKREVILTMLNQLEKIGDDKSFMKLESILPAQIGLRFHKASPQELAKDNEFIREILEISKEYQGVYRCSLPELAYNLKIHPNCIPKILFNLQSSEEYGISYEVDHDSFVVKLKNIPSGGSTMDLSEYMLRETRRIEKNMVQKLNCIYFVARKVSLPTVEYMLKKEKSENAEAMYKGFSKQLNDLINMYFNIENEENMEIQIAGSDEERKLMMPLLYIDSHREKSEIEGDIKYILKSFHESSKTVQTTDPNERMKPLDVTKILMGIYSDRQHVKRFMNETRIFARRQGYDYEDVMKLAQTTVSQFYLDQVADGSIEAPELAGPPSKMKKVTL